MSPLVRAFVLYATAGVAVLSALGMVLPSIPRGPLATLFYGCLVLALAAFAVVWLTPHRTPPDRWERR